MILKLSIESFEGKEVYSGLGGDSVFGERDFFARLESLESSLGAYGLKALSWTFLEGT